MKIIVAVVKTHVAVEDMGMSNTHPFLKKVLGTSFFLSLFLILLSSSILFNAMNLKFYEKQYNKLRLDNHLQMSKADYLNATNDLLQYINGKRSEITVQATINGVNQQVFNEKEKLHMVDVKNLFQSLKRITIVLLTVIFSILLVVYIRMKKETIRLVTTYRYALFIFCVFFAVIVILMLTQFDLFWDLFHRVLFTNDLWLLNPNTDFMIRMFPLELFQSLVFTIIGWFILGMFLIGFAVYLARKKTL